MDFSSCPICNSIVLFRDKANPVVIGLSPMFHRFFRHANQHFQDEDEARDIEFARRISLFPPSPSPTDNDFSIWELDSWDRPSSSTSGSDTKITTTASTKNNNDEAFASLVLSQKKESFYRIEGDLMIMLRKCLESEPGSSTAIVCGYIDHFQSTAFHDVGWGCGWRNIQMLSSYLIRQGKEARESLYGGSGFVPDIESLQGWLELAWAKGFDPPGSYDFDRKIYGRRNWIGTTECAALFRSFGLRARIVDFSGKKTTEVHGPMDRFVSKGKLDSSVSVSSGNESYRHSSVLPNKSNGHQVLARWVWNYFYSSSADRSGNRRVVLSDKSPLYFQHDGHSRTIVGIQAKPQNNGMQQYNLLILDPGENEISLGENVGWQKLIKRGVHTLRKPQYQLYYIDPGIANGKEFEELKNIHSVLHEL